MIYRGNRTTSTPHSTFSPLFHLDPLVDWRRRLTILVSPSLPVDLWLCLHSHWTPYHFLLLFCVAAVGRSVISGRQLLHCNFAFPLLSLYSYFFINILFAYAFNDVSDCLQCRPSDGFICSRILLYLFLYWLHFYHQYLLRITNQLECGGRWVDCIQARLSFFVPQTHTHTHTHIQPTPNFIFCCYLSRLIPIDGVYTNTLFKPANSKPLRLTSIDQWRNQFVHSMNGPTN